MNIWQRKLMAAGLSGYREEANDNGGDSLLNDNKQEEPQETQEELIARLQRELATANDEKGRLSENNQKLLSEKKAKQEEARQAQKEREQAELEAKRKAGDVESVEKHWSTRLEAETSSLREELAKRDNMLLGGDKTAAIADLKTKFTDASQGFAALALANMIETSYGEDGTIKRTYKNENGEVIGTDADSFLSYLKGSDLFKNHIKGVESSGGLQQNSRPGNGQNSQFSTANINGNLDEQMAAQVNANPSLKDLPLR